MSTLLRIYDDAVLAFFAVWTVLGGAVALLLNLLGVA